MVPNGSILGPALYNIFMCDLLAVLNETSIANYVDNCTTKILGDLPAKVVKSLETCSVKLF